MKKYSLVFVIFFTLCAVTSCVKNSDYIINDGLNADSIIKIVSITPASSEADSFSNIIVRIAVNQYTEAAVNVTLSTNLGIINSKSQSETAKVTAPRYVDFILTTGQMWGPLKLRAGVADSFFRDTVITIVKAYPDSVLVQPDKHYIDKNTDMEVGIRLFRKTGYPSIQQSFLLIATDTLGNPAGNLVPTDDYEPGKEMSALFTPENNFIGVVNLKVYVVREDGTKIVGSTKITVQ